MQWSESDIELENRLQYTVNHCHPRARDIGPLIYFPFYVHAGVNREPFTVPKHTVRDDRKLY